MPKHCFMYINEKLQWLPSAKDNMHVLYKKKAKNIAQRFYIQKARHFATSKTIYVTFLYTKSFVLYVSQFFMNILNLAFICKKRDTLHYVTFLYTKIQTLRKMKDNLRYAFIYKDPDTLRYAIFHWIFEIGEGGHFFIQKIMYFALNFYKQNKCNFRYVFNTESFTLSVTFL